MTHSRRTAVLLMALTLTLTAPAAASARPISVYELFHTQGTGAQFTSFLLELDEAESATMHFSHGGFELIDCAGEMGTRTTAAEANGPVHTLAFSVDRKLSSFAWSGTVEVTESVSTYCPQTGHTTTTVSGAWAFEVSGAASDRLNRARMNGDRVLTSTLDHLTVGIEGSTYEGVGLLSQITSRS
jgi:hypothetical protein